MLEELRIFWLLLGPKVAGLVRMSRSGEARHPLRLLFFAALGLLFAGGIYLGCIWFLRQCLQVELVGAWIPRKLLSLVLLVLGSILLLSTTINSFSVFFLSEDLPLLFASPVTPGPLYFARFTEMLVYASWMVIFFGLPIFLAFGRVYSASGTYYLGVAVLFLPMILIPAALGATVASVLTRLFSARRSRDLLIILVVAAFVLMYLLIRTMRPERLLEQESFGTMMQFLEMFRAPESRFLPTQWMTEALFGILERKTQSGLLPALAIWSTALALVAISGFIGTALYRSGFTRAQEGRTRKTTGTDRAQRARVLGRWLDRIGSLLPSFTGSLLVKDLRVFLRDTNQWLQLLLLGALAAVYLLNFVYLKVANFSWFTLYTVNHVLMGLVISGIAVRFVFPAVSLEGRAFWIIRSAPIPVSRFLHSKFLVHFVPLSGLGVALSAFSCVVIGVPLAFGVLSLGLVLTLSLGVSAIGVGIGALYPRFTVENPAKIPTGIGGVTFMITSMTFVLLFLLSCFYPTFVLYQLPQHHPGWIGRPLWFFGSLFSTVAFSTTAAWLPLFLGRRKLERWEE